VPTLTKHPQDPATTLPADAAVRAVERALVTGSPDLLVDTLTIATAAQARRRLARVLALKEQAERDAARRAEYQHAADRLRSWAATVYLATLHAPPGPGR
jgi:hypothetical protein